MVSISVEKDIVPRIKDLVIDSFCAVKTQLNPNHRKNHFELFGYDFLIDEDFRTWLIEINSNPYIGTPCSYIKDLVPQMIDEMFSLVVDPVYPPSANYQAPQDKKFELIYKEGSASAQSSAMYNANNPHHSPFRVNQDLHFTQLINQRRPFSLALLYPLNQSRMLLTSRKLSASPTPAKKKASIHDQMKV